MASVNNSAEVARGVLIPWRGILPHAVMIAVMAYAVIGGHSPAKCLLGAVVLIVGSVVMAPAARRSVQARLNILDFWAMALAMLVLLPHRELIDSPNLHSHGGALGSGGTTAFLVVSALWLVGRVAAAVASRDARGRASIVGAVLTALGLAVMFAFCR